MFCLFVGFETGFYRQAWPWTTNPPIWWSSQALGLQACATVSSVHSFQFLISICSGRGFWTLHFHLNILCIFFCSCTFSSYEIILFVYLILLFLIILVSLSSSFEIASLYTAQDILKLSILLPQLLRIWVFRCAATWLPSSLLLLRGKQTHLRVPALLFTQIP